MRSVLDAEQKRIRKLAVAEIIRQLDEGQDTRIAMVRAAHILDHVSKFFYMLPHNDEFDALLRDHIEWIERKRERGEYPAAATIKRPVAKPKGKRK